MNQALNYLLGRRLWLVPQVNVWGEIAAFEWESLLTENEGSQKRILFGAFPLGGSQQRLNYGDLIDIRGNKLPATLSNPRVVILGKNDVGVIVAGTETATAFNLAKTETTSKTGVVDLLVIELG